MARNPNLANENLKFATGIAAGPIEIGQPIKRTANPGEFEVCDTLGEQSHGIAFTEAAAAGDSFTYSLPTPGALLGAGLSGAAISVGDDLTTNAAGKIIATVTVSHSIIGVAQSAVAGADEFVQLTLEDGQRTLP